MLNNEGSHSEYFEELCALAAGGQISEPEFVELRDHMQHCAQCRSAYADFIDLVHNKLPLVDPELMGSFKPRAFFRRVLHIANGFSHGRAKRVLPFHMGLCAIASGAGWESGCFPDWATHRLRRLQSPCCW